MRDDWNTLERRVSVAVWGLDAASTGAGSGTGRHSQ
jgi:hypothetical protein